METGFYPSQCNFSTGPNWRSKVLPEPLGEADNHYTLVQINTHDDIR